MTRPIFIICAPSMGFPEGMAATARVTQYAKALRDSGDDVTVICPAPSEADAASARNTQVSGTSEGIAFWYSSGSTVRLPGFVRRRAAAIRSWTAIVARVVHDRPIAVLVYPMTPTLASLLVPVAHALGVRIVCDQSELPEVHAGAGVLGRVRLAVRVWGMRHSDAVIAINPAIVARVTPMVSPAEVHYLPVIIDCDDYTGDLAPSARSEIVYTGPLNNVKDGVDVLLDAFALVKAAIPDCWLVLLGDDDRSRVDRARSHARSLGVEDRVEFRGAVPRPELLAAVARATVLVLPRPDTEQNRSNMPTKLVEYLASGRPVVATTVGLTPAMVDNGSAAVLVAPGDAEALAKGLIGVLSDPDAAAAMGTRGRLRALSTYDFRQYSSMLHTLATGTPRKADRP